MTIPTFQQLMLPMLRRAVMAQGETQMRDLEEAIADDLGLPREDRSRLVPSGQQSVFGNRLGWAKSYMSKAGLIDTTRRGYFAATQRARELIAENPPEIDVKTLSRYPEFVAWRALEKSGGEPGGVEPIESGVSPEDYILASYERITKELTGDLLHRLQRTSPSFFERLIVDLLLKMGYGGGRADMARALGRSGDGGIDGVVKEDELGLDVVYVQAKRYAPKNAVGVSEIRDFVGSLDAHRASKGVFVTTSYFPPTARDFVTRVSKRVVLIDGPELARLMIRHGVGVRTKEVYEIKRMDEDYFVE